MGGGGCHPQVGFLVCALRHVCEARDLIFAVAAFEAFFKIIWKFQVTATFGS